ncbi:MAG: hypothetical protein MUF15_22930 [Acidobacteria bacterium]|nr:hypothetical protein [Acidobacteriota bacterium]
MKSLVLDIDDNVYEKFINFLKIFPKNKFKIIEEIPCSKELERELKKRKKEIASGHVLTHKKIWENAGI